MQNKLRVIVVFAALFISALLYFVVRKVYSNEPENVFVSSDWNKMNGPVDLEPNGFGLFTKSLLKGHSSKEVQVLSNSVALKRISEGKDLFIVMGETVAFLEKEWNFIRTRIEKGATLFVCADRLSGKWAHSLLQDGSLGYIYAPSVEATFFTEKRASLGLKLFQNDTVAKKWYFMETDVLEDPLSYLREPEYTGSARFRFGQGQVILYINVDLLRNYQLNRPKWRPHVNRLLTEIPSFDRMYWLTFGLMSDTETITGQEKGNGTMQDTSLLKLFFSNRTLSMALLLSSIGCLLFLLCRIRRTEPVVPLPKKERQHSKEFTRTITSIFINRRDPYGILQLQKKNFYGMIQRNYYMDISRKEDSREREKDLLSQKSGVDKEDIQRILQLLETKVRINVTDGYLFEVHKRIQEFYRKAGIERSEEKRMKTETADIKRSITSGLLMASFGLFLFVSGLWFLTKAQSIGVILFMVAIILFGWAFRTINIPVLSWTRDTLKINFLGLSTKEFQWEDLRSVESDSNLIKWRFTGDRFVHLRWSEISSFDHGQLRRLIEIKSKNK